LAELIEGRKELLGSRSITLAHVRKSPQLGLSSKVGLANEVISPRALPVPLPPEAASAEKSSRQPNTQEKPLLLIRRLESAAPFRNDFLHREANR
jgi:hypothetical protein